jgi:hypothetical protein
VKLVHVSVLAVAATLVPITAAGADTFIVTTTEDSGSGSFRWAVEQSNTHVGPDTVAFAIPTSDTGYDPQLGVWTITADTIPLCGYDIDDNGTFVDGRSQTRFAGGDPNPYGPEIELAGPGAGLLQACFDITSDDNVIRGLCIHSFDSGGIMIGGWPPGEVAERNVVEGCYLNVDPTGTRGAGGARYGINVISRAWGLQIGGDTLEERNIISGAGNRDLCISSCGDVEIVNNLIGTDRTGTVALEGPWDDVVWIHNITGPCVVRNNLIGGDEPNALVHISGTSPDSATVTFTGNRVGVGLDGTPMGAEDNNIMLGSAPGNLLADNVIAHTRMWEGIDLADDATDYVTISRNAIYGCTGDLGIGLFNMYNQNVWGVDYADGVYGPGVNEEIDTPLCDSIVSSPEGQGGTTTVSFRCMPDCVVEVFVGDPVRAAVCSEPGFGDVYSGMTYLGNAQEVVVGEPWSTYRFIMSPALAAGTFVTCTATNQNGSTSEFGCSCRVPQQGAAERGCLPTEFRFWPPSPNPCRESIVLRYDLPRSCRVRITAHDVEGSLVATILDEHQAGGIYAVKWEAQHRQGAEPPCGLYLLRLVSDEFVACNRVVIAR